MAEYSQRLTAAIGFDVMWAMMLAMKEASKQRALELNSDYMGNTKLTKLLNDELRNVSFEGLTVIGFAITCQFYRRIKSVFIGEAVRITNTF